VIGSFDVAAPGIAPKAIFNNNFLYSIRRAKIHARRKRPPVVRRVRQIVPQNDATGEQIVAFRREKRSFCAILLTISHPALNFTNHNSIFICCLNP
jgi:hypothetical protein